MAASALSESEGQKKSVRSRFPLESLTFPNCTDVLTFNEVIYVFVFSVFILPVAIAAGEELRSLHVIGVNIHFNA